MKSLLDRLFVREKHVCPWWCCFTFDNPIRALFQNPYTLLAPYVKPGMTSIDIGPGMGYFTIPLCQMVGPHGKVIAVDIQHQMLADLLKRAAKKGVRDNLHTHLSQGSLSDLHEQADFILAFWMVHEVPDQRQFFSEVAHLMRPDATFLLVEPFVHVTRTMFTQTVQTACAVGLTIQEQPQIAFSRAVLCRVQ